MLDIKRIKEDPQAVKAGLRAKEADCDAAIDRILELDEQRRALIADTEQKKAEQKKNKQNEQMEWHFPKDGTTIRSGEGLKKIAFSEMCG